MLDFVSNNLNEIVLDTKLFDKLKRAFPEIVHKVHERRHRCDVVLAAPLFNDMLKKRDEELLGADAKVPWTMIGVALACAFMYKELIRVVAFGPVVPAVNILTLIGVAYYVFQQIKS